MAMYGQGVTRGRVALLEIEATYNQACAAITFGPRVLPSYARYFFMAAYEYVREGGNETSQMNLSAGLIAKFRVSVPPAEEQSGIVRFLDIESRRLDVLMSEAVVVIDLLRERRTALISAAVTGQIDVRGWEPTEAVA
jgi:type I restriction enzyme S subunit